MRKRPSTSRFLSTKIQKVNLFLKKQGLILGCEPGTFNIISYHELQKAQQNIFIFVKNRSMKYLLIIACFVCSVFSQAQQKTDPWKDSQLMDPALLASRIEKKNSRSGHYFGRA